MGRPKAVRRRVLRTSEPALRPRARCTCSAPASRPTRSPAATRREIGAVLSAVASRSHRPQTRPFLPAPTQVLYIRPDSKLDGSKPISGGIPIVRSRTRVAAHTRRRTHHVALLLPPVPPPPHAHRAQCFPIFGPGSMQQHGFARNQAWSVLSSSGDVNPDYPEPSVTLRLSETAYSLAMWPHHFQARRARAATLAKHPTAPLLFDAPSASSPPASLSLSSVVVRSVCPRFRRCWR